MLASSADFNQIDETAGATADWPEQWAGIRKIIWDLAALWNGHMQIGTAPDDTFLAYIYFAESASKRHHVRVGYFGADVFVISYNSGTDGSPFWVALLSINVSTKAVTLYGNLGVPSISGLSVGLTLGGDLNLSSNDIINVNTITAALVNGIDPADHHAEHLQTGADPLDVSGAIASVGGANSSGAASNLCRRDHVHQGTSSIVAGARINISPVSGLGAVTVNVNADRTKVAHNNTGTGDQGIGASGAETSVTGLIGKAFPGAPAINKWYEISGQVLCHYDAPANPNGLTVRLYIGTTGSKTDAPAGLVQTWSSPGPREQSSEEMLISVPFGPIPYQLTNAAHLIGLSFQVDSIVGGVVPGANTAIKGSAGEYSFIYAKEMPF
jgi:hypothetical protein